jgi:hypothetical protein
MSEANIEVVARLYPGPIDVVAASLNQMLFVRRLNP